jgi:hypothetical protein
MDPTKAKTTVITDCISREQPFFPTRPMNARKTDLLLPSSVHSPARAFQRQLDTLEEETIFILREVAGETFEKRQRLFSGGELL